jgi:hypothetical protein
MVEWTVRHRQVTMGLSIDVMRGVSTKGCKIYFFFASIALTLLVSE